MQLLNQPEALLRTREGEIFCQIRKKWLVLQPEEWVRQHFIYMLIELLDYPKGLVSVEYSIKYFRNAKRSDIVILNHDGQVFMLIECKAPDVRITNKSAKQVAEYAKILPSKYIVLTNGIKHYTWKKMANHYQQQSTFPIYKG